MAKRWQAQGVITLPPAERDEVLATFTGIGSIATSDVLELYGLLGGMHDMDHDYWRLWSLDEIKKENAEPSTFGVLFSDYMIEAWCYRLKPNSNGTSSVLVDCFDGKEPALVAESVAEFFDRYASDPMVILNARTLEESRGNQ
jgi:hypothetical protein